MKRINRFVSMLISLSLISCLFIGLSTINANAAYKYDASTMPNDYGYNYYKAWSQDQYPWHDTKPYDAYESDWMNRYGCSTIAMTKMFVESGKISPFSYNPYKVMQNFSVTKKSINYITDIGIWWSNLASAFGMEYYGNVAVTPTTALSKVLSYYSKTDSDYYLVLQVNGGAHYVQIDRQKTLENGKDIVINNSTNNGSAGGTLLNSAEAYYNRVADLQLSKTTFRASKIYVFRTVSAPRLSSTKEVTPTSIRVRWYPVGVAEGYRLYKREVGTSKYSTVATIRKASDTSMSYVDTGCKTGVSYQYIVKGFRHDASGKTYWTTYDKTIVLTGVAIAPAAKLIEAKSSGYNSIDIKWNKVVGATGYRIYRKAADETAYTTLVSRLNGEGVTAYTDSTVTTGKAYSYKVRAYTKVESTYVWGASSANSMTATAVPDTPEVLSAKRKTFNSVGVEWTAVDGASGYRMLRKAPGEKKFHVVDKVVGKNNLSYTNTDLETNSTYTYSVKAYRTVNKVDINGNFDTVGKSAKPTLSMPSSFETTSAGYAAIKLTWQQPEGANGYYIYRQVFGETKWTKIGEAPITSTNRATYTDKTCVTGTVYVYTVKAYRNVKTGVTTSSMDNVGIQGRAMPIPPTMGKVTSAKTGMTISWSKAGGATGYRIYRRASGGSWETICSGTKSLQYVDTTAKKGTKYYYRAKTYRRLDGVNYWSNFSAKSACVKCLY